jgi:DNA-binding GntR family transcriptional regulator
MSIGDPPSVIGKTSLAHQISRYLRESILEDRLPGGERLKEREVAESLSVSRTPVREALRMLEGEGLVVRTGSGYGVVVERSLDDMLEAFHVRIALECYAVRLVATSASEAQLLCLVEADRDVQSLVERERFEELKQYGADFHQRIIELTGNNRIIRLFRDIIEYIDLYRQRLYKMPQFLEQNLVTHHQILQALRSRDEDKAAALMREHLRSSMEIVRALWEQDHRPQTCREGEHHDR